VEIVKRHDAFCGGPTKVAIIPKEGEMGGPIVVDFPQKEIDRAATLILEADTDTKAERVKLIRERILNKGLGAVECIDL